MKYPITVAIALLLALITIGCSNNQIKIKTPSGEDGPVIGRLEVSSPAGMNISSAEGQPEQEDQKVN